MADEVVVSGATPDTGGSSVTDQGGAPTPIELKDDSLVRLPGSEKPVKYGEWFRGFQSKHTEATTQRSQLARQLEQFKQERAAEQAELARYRAAHQPRQAEPKFDLADRLKDLPYLNGQEAAQLGNELFNQLRQRDQALSARDQAIRLLAQKIQQMDGMINSMGSRFASTDFKSKIGKFRDQLGLPEDATEWLEELYSAYEGDDLDEQFPQIAQKRWEQLQSLTRALDRKRAEEARRNRFVPGKGGMGSASKPVEFESESPKEIADRLWGMVQGEEQT